MTTRTVAPFDSPSNGRRVAAQQQLDSSQPAADQQLSEAQIVDAVVKTIQSVAIASRILINDMHIKLQRSIEGEILTATVRPEISLIFRGEE